LVFPFRRGGRPFRRRVRNAVEHPPWLFKRSDQFLSRWIVSFRLSSRLASPRLTSPHLVFPLSFSRVRFFSSFSLFFPLFLFPPPLSLSLSLLRILCACLFSARAVYPRSARRYYRDDTPNRIIRDRLIRQESTKTASVIRARA